MWHDYEEAAYRPDSSITPLELGSDDALLATRGTGMARAMPLPVRARTAPELTRGIADLAAEIQATLDGGFTARAYRALAMLAGSHAGAADDGDADVDDLADRFKQLSRVRDKLLVADNTNAKITGEVQAVFASKIERRVQSSAEHAALPAQRHIRVHREHGSLQASNPPGPTIAGAPALTPRKK